MFWPATASVAVMAVCTNDSAAFFFSVPDLCPKSPSTTRVIAGPFACACTVHGIIPAAATTSGRQKNRPIGRRALRITCASLPPLLPGRDRNTLFPNSIAIQAASSGSAQIVAKTLVILSQAVPPPESKGLYSRENAVARPTMWVPHPSPRQRARVGARAASPITLLSRSLVAPDELLHAAHVHIREIHHFAPLRDGFQ